MGRFTLRGWVRLVVGLLLVPALVDRAPSLAGLPATVPGSGGAPAAAAPAGVDASTVAARFGQLPLSFIANAGRSEPRVAFEVRHQGARLGFGPSRLTLVLPGAHPPAPSGPAGLGGATAPPGGSAPFPPGREAGRPPGTAEAEAGPAEAEAPTPAVVVELTFPGAQAEVLPQGEEQLPGIANFFLGNDPSQWRTHVPTYAAIRYPDLYPGIDLVYRGQLGHLKSEWVVAPGADPGQIRLRYAGAGIGLALDAAGALHVTTPAGEVVEAAPVVSQERDGGRVTVASRYVLLDERTVGFWLDTYDQGRPLLLDPELVYSTHLGGGGDVANAIAVDGQGRAYVTGSTTSPNFPTTPGALQLPYGGVGDAFVTQLTATGTALGYSTFLGGSGSDAGAGIAVDAQGYAYVTGSTASANFPTTPGALQPTYGDGGDAFVAQLTATGSALGYSTFLGGSGGDAGHGIAVDAKGYAYVTGSTASANFPTTPGVVQSTFDGGFDAFVARLRIGNPPIPRP